MNIDLIEVNKVEEVCADLRERFPKDLYLDLTDKEQRKFAKDSAKEVTELIKKIDRARIDANNAYSSNVNNVADELKKQLTEASGALLELIDEYESPRKEKQRQEREEKKLAEYESKAKYAKYELFTQLEELAGFELAETISDLIANNKLKHVEFKLEK